ncbi:hypothetical protein ANN_11769 [Periplaneta americana]|uniref:Uncharacterized protein n=1 Tax=Periplaneta americana TaxID=6978 RepID=A0ABQ8T5Z6_PERAM|nr:hypothetical protein ANN_11769 [Periplaneta americana]
MKIVKTKLISRLTDKYLRDQLRLAVSDIIPDFETMSQRHSEDKFYETTKVARSDEHLVFDQKVRSGVSSIPGLGSLPTWVFFSRFFLNRKVNVRKNDTEIHQEEKKKLVGPLAEKKLPAEGYTERNGERKKSSWQKKISDDRRHEMGVV